MQKGFIHRTEDQVCMCGKLWCACPLFMLTAQWSVQALARKLEGCWMLVKLQFSRDHRNRLLRASILSNKLPLSLSCRCTVYVWRYKCFRFIFWLFSLYLPIYVSNAVGYLSVEQLLRIFALLRKPYSGFLTSPLYLLLHILHGAAVTYNLPRAPNFTTPFNFTPTSWGWWLLNKANIDIECSYESYTVQMYIVACDNDVKQMD